MKEFIVLDEIDMSKLNNNEIVKLLIDGQIIYLCNKDCFKEECSTKQL